MGGSLEGSFKGLGVPLLGLLERGSFIGIL